MKKYFILIRPYGMLFLGFTPVFTAIANGKFSFTHLSILFIIGLLMHIFTFVQNDYYDVKIDSKSEYVSNRPFVTGEISSKKVITIFLLSFISSIVLCILFVFTIYSFIMLILSFLFISLYNKYSKQFSGMEYILSLGVFSFGLFGALTVSNNITNFALIVSTFGFLQWLFSVGISANLKDVKFDSKQNIKTTPIIFGVKVVDNKLKIPSIFKIYAFSIKIIHILILTLLYIYEYTHLYIYKLPIVGILFIIISIILLILTEKILTTQLIKRDKILIYIGLQEGLALLLLPITLMQYLIENINLIPTMIIILLLILWPIFCFRTLFGKKMIPLE